MQHFSHHYQSDISRQQFDLIRQDLEASRKRTHPKHIDPYDIFCAMLYVLKMAVLGVICRLIIQSGPPFTTIGWVGQKPPPLINQLY